MSKPQKFCTIWCGMTFHTSTENPKEYFNDSVFHHFVDELKHCNLNMQMDLQLLV